MCARRPGSSCSSVRRNPAAQAPTRWPSWRRAELPGGGAPRKSRSSARCTAARGCMCGNRATQTAQELKVLHYSTYVAPSKPAVSDDLPPGELRRMWSPTAATLICGERDAVLVDPLMTAAEGEDLAGWIAASGKNLTTIFVTHGHGDHFFGAAPVLARFPGAKMVATPAVVEGMKKQLNPAWLDGFWRARFPGQLPDRLFAAEPLEGDTFMLEGQALVAVDLGH